MQMFKSSSLDWLRWQPSLSFRAPSGWKSTRTRHRLRRAMAIDSIFWQTGLASSQRVFSMCCRLFAFMSFDEFRFWGPRDGASIWEDVAGTAAKATAQQKHGGLWSATPCVTVLCYFVVPRCLAKTVATRDLQRPTAMLMSTTLGRLRTGFFSLLDPQKIPPEKYRFLVLGCQFFFRQWETIDAAMFHSVSISVSLEIAVNFKQQKCRAGNGLQWLFHIVSFIFSAEGYACTQASVSEILWIDVGGIIRF